MNDTVCITPAGADDIPLICATADEVWPEVYSSILSPEQISYMMKMMYSLEVIKKEMASGVEWFIVKTGGDMAGYASIFETVSDGIPAVKLDKIYLKESCRGKGVGRALLAHIVQKSKNAGVSQIILNVNKYNAPAQAAYKSWGFVLKKSEVNDIGNGFVMDDHVLALDI